MTSVESFKLGINFTNKIVFMQFFFYKFARFFTVHAVGEGMNVIVRRDGGEFHVLGGGAGNETTHYEFERGCKIDPGYHVYQVCVSHCLCHLAFTICRLFLAPKLFMMFIVQVWLVNSLWHTVSFDDVVFELLPQ